MNSDQSRIKAALNGLTRYKGNPCNRGHATGRYTSTGNCVECNRIAARERQRAIRALDRIPTLA